jgi:hypothetical protein
MNPECHQLRGPPQPPPPPNPPAHGNGKQAHQPTDPPVDEPSRRTPARPGRRRSPTDPPQPPNTGPQPPASHGHTHDPAMNPECHQLRGTPHNPPNQPRRALFGGANGLLHTLIWAHSVPAVPPEGSQYARFSSRCFWFCGALRADGMRSLAVQRSPVAASAEFGPCGSVSSNVPTGTSGMVRNVELVIPSGLMNVSPCRSTVTP